MISAIDATQFESQVLASPVPVLIEFFTEYCYPCQRMLPILAEIAGERPSTLRVFKFNAENDPAFSARFRVNSFPGFLLFEGGGPVAQRSGFLNKRELLAWVDSNVRPTTR